MLSNSIRDKTENTQASELTETELGSVTGGDGKAVLTPAQRNAQRRQPTCEERIEILGLLQ